MIWVWLIRFILNDVRLGNTQDCPLIFNHMNFRVSLLFGHKEHCRGTLKLGVEPLNAQSWPCTLPHPYPTLTRLQLGQAP